MASNCQYGREMNVLWGEVNKAKGDKTRETSEKGGAGRQMALIAPHRFSDF
jgi:hypothetical protein